MCLGIIKYVLLHNAGGISILWKGIDTMIFFINEFLSAQGIAVQVGLNPWTVLTSGILGTPGVALLYGISFYGIL